MRCMHGAIVHCVGRRSVCRVQASVDTVAGPECINMGCMYSPGNMSPGMLRMLK
jgi:hypothetical protein